MCALAAHHGAHSLLSCPARRRQRGCTSAMQIPGGLCMAQCKTLRRVSMVLLVSACPFTAAAQAPTAGSPPDGATGMTLEQLLSVNVQHVTGASRFNQDVVDAPAAVTIITREEIYTFGYRTLADVLRGVRGYYVSNDRNYSYLGVRGFSRPGDYNSRLLLLVDGHRMNDNVYD